MEHDGPVSGVDIPDGTPATLFIPFSSIDQYEVEVGTKSEASFTDESRIHNLYVMLFDNTQKVSDGVYTDSPKKIYGRYFSYDHLKDDGAALNADDNECWFVKNRLLEQGEEVLTEGAVKISTVTCSDAILVVIANVTNAVTNLDGMNGLDRLKAVQHYKELKDINVCLEQDVVNRKDLFLMTGELANKDTRDLMWNTYAGSVAYNSTYRVELKHVDAKVKFRVRINRNNISAATPVYWQVCNTPDRCYLYTKSGRGNAPAEIDHFSSQQYYFEGTEYEKDSSGNIVKELDPTTGEMVPITYYTFCFYMLENNQSPNGTADKYYQRELRNKIDSGESGYKGKTGSESGAFGNHYVENGEWKYAPTYGTYVRFDLVLTLTSAGIAEVGSVDTGQLSITQALTSDAIFTVHLGDFANSGDRTLKDGTPIAGSQFNDYETKRGHSYTYTITINNTTNIYAEVTNDEEVQAGQEGFLLLTDTEIINADCHYEYHQITFNFRSHLDQNKFSWYVKTPFGEGGPVVTKNLVTGEYSYDGSGLDYLWVKFGVNKKVGSPGYVPSDGTEKDPEPTTWNDFANGGALVQPYSKKRHAYPGDNHYDPNWKPGQTPAPSTDDDGDGVPDLMDITQLIQYIFYETKLEDDSPGSSDFIYDSGTADVPVIRVTAFIDEYYYESDPTKPGATVDPDLWRKFVNANPRELHILSDAQSSRDRRSDVIISSHSIIQQSIQTIYNIYSADLQSLWGTEHTDEMRDLTSGWPYWPDGKQNSGRAGDFGTITGKENGRLNSAFIWLFYSSKDNNGSDLAADWSTYLDYAVHNDIPELKKAYEGMAWSCMTRNRDNNGDGHVDRNEVRWYLAAPNQLIGMWVGNESLSVNARLYRPAKNQWRAHILSSADRRVCWSEEGGGATEYQYEANNIETWVDFFAAAEGESVRCLRNIGTYYDEAMGNTQDITEAPYKIMPQNYFTITPEPNEDLAGVVDSPSEHYVFSFDRLNPKSLRELTEGELPFNDQFSVNNCVYLKMETQSRNDEKSLLAGDGDAYPLYDYPYNLGLDVVNEDLDRLGFNPYCPKGYRFPNQAEMLLMSVYLPESYFLRDADGTGYSSDTFMPTRTYYDRGYFGKKTEGFEYDREGLSGATTREQKKVGWAYHIQRKKNTTARRNQHYMKRSRCVRDINMTGTIEGGLLMKDELYPGDNVPLSFSFYSSGSAFISASLKFCYTDGSGVYHERDIPVQTTPSGFQFLADQTVKMPTIAEMGLGDQPLSTANPKFKVTLRNAYISKTFEQPITLGNPLEASLTLKGEVPSEVYPADAKTVDIDFGSKAHTCKLNTVSLKLTYKDKTNADREVSAATLGIPSYTSNTSVSYKHSNVSLTIPNLSSLNLPTDADFTRPANFVIELSDMGGSTFTKSVPVTLSNPLAVTDAFVLSDAIGNKIYPSDENHVSVGVHSKASSINLTSVSMALCYGASTTIPITSIPSLVGSVNTYSLTNQSITIPALAAMTGLTEASLDTGEPATIRLTVTAGDYTKTFETDALTISHPIAADEFSIDTSNDEIYPGDSNTVTLTAAAKGNHPTNLTTATVQLYDGDTPMGSYIVNVSGINAATYTSSGAVTIPTLSDLGLTVSALDPGTSYTLRAIVSNADGLSRTINKTLTLSNPLTGSFSLVGNNELLPGQTKEMNINLSSLANSCRLAGVTLKLKYKNTSNADAENTLMSILDVNALTYVSSNASISIPNIGSLDDLQSSDLPRYATLELEVSDHGGASKTFTLTTVNNKHLLLGEDPHFDGFRIRAKYDGTTMTFKYTDGSVQFSEDLGITWTTYDGRVFNLNKDDVVCFRGTRANCDCNGTTQLFSANQVCYIAGKITSLLADRTQLATNAFRSAFSNGNSNNTNPATVTWVDIDSNDPLILPAFTSTNCYREMFRACSSLTSVPELPSTTVSPQCYFNMFRSCTGLKNADIELPATTLAEDCYRELFRQCSNLKTVPVFQAPILVARCYQQMLSQCTSLESVTCLATDISAASCTENWMSGTKNSNTCTFYKASSMSVGGTDGWTRGNNGILSNWQVEDFSE